MEQLQLNVRVAKYERGRLFNGFDVNRWRRDLDPAKNAARYGPAACWRVSRLSKRRARHTLTLLFRHVCPAGRSHVLWSRTNAVVRIRWSRRYGLFFFSFVFVFVFFFSSIRTHAVRLFVRVVRATAYLRGRCAFANPRDEFPRTGDSSFSIFTRRVIHFAALPPRRKLGLDPPVTRSRRLRIADSRIYGRTDFSEFVFSIVHLNWTSRCYTAGPVRPQFARCSTV